MNPRVKEFAVFFGLQFLSYLNVTLDMRAVAHQQYVVAAMTNAVAPLIAWVMVERIANAKRGWVGKVAVVLGGVTSTWFGMWLTRQW
jgi:hypothetical protein